MYEYYEPFIACIPYRTTAVPSHIYFTALPLIHLSLYLTSPMVHSSILRVRTATVGCSGDYALLVPIIVDHQ